MELVQLLMNHAADILQILTGTIAVASLIANLTPTDHDNALVAKAGKIINLLALNLKK